jgi:ammonia channel protein AmtB
MHQVGKMKGNVWLKLAMLVVIAVIAYYIYQSWVWFSGLLSGDIASDDAGATLEKGIKDANELFRNLLDIFM